MFLLNDRYLFKFTYQYVTFNISQAKYFLKLITLMYWNILLVQNKLDTRTSMRNSERFIKNRNKNLLSMFKLKDRHFLKFTCPYPFLISIDHLVYTLEVTIPAPYPYTSQDLQNYKVRKLQITVVSRFPNTGVTSTYGRSVKATRVLFL